MYYTNHHNCVMTEQKQEILQLWQTISFFVYFVILTELFVYDKARLKNCFVTK